MPSIRMAQRRAGVHVSRQHTQILSEKGFKPGRKPITAEFPFDADEIIYAWDLDKDDEEAAVVGIPDEYHGLVIDQLKNLAKAKKAQKL